MLCRCWRPRNRVTMAASWTRETRKEVREKSLSKQRRMTCKNLQMRFRQGRNLQTRFRREERRGRRRGMQEQRHNSLALCIHRRLPVRRLQRRLWGERRRRSNRGRKLQKHSSNNNHNSSNNNNSREKRQQIQDSRELCIHHRLPSQVLWRLRRREKAQRGRRERRQKNKTNLVPRRQKLVLRGVLWWRNWKKEEERRWRERSEAKHPGSQPLFHQQMKSRTHMRWREERRSRREEKQQKHNNNNNSLALCAHQGLPVLWRKQRQQFKRRRRLWRKKGRRIFRKSVQKQRHNDNNDNNNNNIKRRRRRLCREQSRRFRAT
mmetsp:Transcript_28827/g.51515  ORF Transcript_28827/g.51515 Transcript_28827/m.51515 type:complete len:320 (+) Transcript_28827:2012-2971(+)